MFVTAKNNRIYRIINHSHDEGKAFKEENLAFFRKSLVKYLQDLKDNGVDIEEVSIHDWDSYESSCKDLIRLCFEDTTSVLHEIKIVKQFLTLNFATRNIVNSDTQDFAEDITIQQALDVPALYIAWLYFHERKILPKELCIWYEQNGNLHANVLNIPDFLIFQKDNSTRLYYNPDDDENAVKIENPVDSDIVYNIQSRRYIGRGDSRKPVDIRGKLDKKYVGLEGGKAVPGEASKNPKWEEMPISVYESILTEDEKSTSKVLGMTKRSKSIAKEESERGRSKTTKPNKKKTTEDKEEEKIDEPFKGILDFPIDVSKPKETPKQATYDKKLGFLVGDRSKLNPDINVPSETSGSRMTTRSNPGLNITNTDTVNIDNVSGSIILNNESTDADLHFAWKTYRQKLKNDEQFDDKNSCWKVGTVAQTFEIKAPHAGKINDSIKAGLGQRVKKQNNNGLWDEYHWWPKSFIYHDTGKTEMKAKDPLDYEIGSLLRYYHELGAGDKQKLKNRMYDRLSGDYKALFDTTTSSKRTEAMIPSGPQTYMHPTIYYKLALMEIKDDNKRLQDRLNQKTVTKKVEFYIEEKERGSLGLNTISEDDIDLEEEQFTEMNELIDNMRKDKQVMNRSGVYSKYLNKYNLLFKKDKKFGLSRYINKFFRHLYN